RRELAVSGPAPLVPKAEAAGRPTCCHGECRIGGLCEVDESLVVAEVLVAQLRMAVEPETLDHESVEVARQEVGQEERRGLVLDEARELRTRGVELVAMRAREALDALLGDHGIEQSARPAVRVRDEDPVVAGPPPTDPPADRGG